jgi:hypothetical protein
MRALLLALLVGCAAAQPASPLGFSSVAEALKALEARDGNGTIVTHADGWTTINEPAAAAQWSFVPASHAAYPAVVRRIIRRGPNGAVSVETGSLCEAAADKCSGLLAEFETMNVRITQAVKARGRQPTSPP